MKLQDEHNCLSLITNKIKQIHDEGGFWTTVMGRRISVRVWIHLIAGDTLRQQSCRARQWRFT